MAETYIVCHIAAFHGNVKIKLFLKAKPCNFVDVNRRFGRIFYAIYRQSIWGKTKVPSLKTYLPKKCGFLQPHRIQYIFVGKIEIFLMLINVVHVVVTVFWKFVKDPRAITVITMSFWKNGMRNTCVLIFHEQSGVTDLTNDFWHTCFSAVGCSVHQQVIYKAPVCRCVRMRQCGLASIAWEHFLTLLPGGFLSTDTPSLVQQCHLFCSCSVMKNVHFEANIRSGVFLTQSFRWRY